MSPAQDIPLTILAASHEIPHRFLRFVGHVNRRQFSGAKQPDELDGVPAIGLDPLARPARCQRGGDDLALHLTRRDLPVEVIPRDPRFVARPDRPLPRQPLEQSPNQVRLLGHLPQLRLRHARPQDADHDFPLAVIERHVCWCTLMHDRSLLSPVALFRPRNNPRSLRDRFGRSFHIV
jgi:hypothetical protein